MKGLSECKESESNVRRIQVKDVVKDAKNHFNLLVTGMDIQLRSAVSISCPDKFACKVDSLVKFTCSKGDLTLVDMMPNIETTNTSPTINVSRSVDDDLLLPQLLDSRGGSHITNVPTFDKDDFTRPSDIKDTKIAALRLKFNAFKALEGEKDATMQITNMVFNLRLVLESKDDEGMRSLLGDSVECVDLVVTLMVELEDEDAEEDSFKQGRKISNIDKDPTISLVHPEKDMEYDFDVSTAEGFTTANVLVTTASAFISTASATPQVSTAAANLVYIRRSAEKRKDKGKAIIKDDESVKKKSKKQLEQERLGHEEAIRLQEQINEEENQRITRDAEIAKQLQEEFDRARQEQEVVTEADQAHDIDWSDPAVLRYHALQNRSFSVAERSRKDSYEDNAKKHKLEDDAEKKELRDSMDVVPRDDIAIYVESLATKYPIVDWKTHVLTENMMYYQIIRADRSSRNYKIFGEMLDDFDRQDVLDLHRLVQERYDTTSPEGYDFLLWGDLKILFEPNEEDEIWKNQQDYNLISWRLFDTCGIHMLLMHTGNSIHIMIEKNYPLIQEMLSRMLSRRLEVDQESEMTFELLRFIRSQLHQ
ncbi:hypothetical protein Tco_0705663 [Tanacetum coccineum]|uniref:Uncharacterized protein n=1 Tax=Tanacetum coccineum TaxID=301880 RepID=A0ABQ4Y7B9_9ASTR